MARSGNRSTLRPITDKIYAGKSLDQGEIKLLKSSGANVIRQVLDRTPVRRLKLLGTPVITNIDDFSKPIPTPNTGILRSEVAWTTASLLHMSPVLRDALASSREIETDIILGRLQQARAKLHEMQTKYGDSIWAISQRILLAELTSGLEGNRREYQLLAEMSPDWLQPFLQCFSHRCEATTSQEEYTKSLTDCFPTNSDNPSTARTCAYFRLRLGIQAPPTSEECCTLLNYEECHSVLDRYHVWSYVIRHAMASGEISTFKDSAQCIRALAYALDDHDASALNSMLHPTDIARTHLFAEVYSLLDAYTKGHYCVAFQRTLELITVHPLCFDLYEILAKSASHISADITNTFPANSIANALLSLVASLIRRDDDSEQHTRQLRREAFRLSSLSFSRSIIAFVDSQNTSGSPSRITAVTACASDIPTPRVLASIPSLGPLSTAQALSSVFPDNACCSLYRHDLSLIYAAISIDPPHIPTGRLLKHKAFVAEVQGRFAEALDAYNAALSCVPYRSTQYTDSVIGCIRCSLLANDINGTVKRAGQLVANGVHTIPADVVCRILTKYSTRDRSGPIDIGWPIVFGAEFRRHEGTVDAKKMHDVLEDFLDSVGVRQPTELLELDLNIERSQLVFLLAHVCTPHVLKASAWYDSQADLEAERVRLCKWLADTDQSRSRDYLNEIADLERRATIRDLIHEADRSRIYVDTASITDGFPHTVVERAERCLTLSRLQDTTLRKSQSLTITDNKGLRMVVIRDEGFQAFASVFHDYRDRFIYSNEYGLDSNLSQRIRHGTLAGEIRARFEDHHFVTHKGLNGQYTTPQYWLDALHVSDDHQHAKVSLAFQVLSRSVDEAIARLKGRSITIRTNDNGDEEAMFDFHFSEKHLWSLYLVMASGIAVQEVADSEVNMGRLVLEDIERALWQRTEDNLERVRRYIETELRDELNSLLQRMSTSVSEILGPEQCASLRSSVTECVTEIGNGLCDIAGWFRIERKHRAPNCSLANVATAVQKVVNKFSGPSKLAVEMDCDDVIVPGQCFRAAWDMLFILFDNVAKHARVEQPYTALRAKVTGKRLVICCENEFSVDVDIGHLHEVAGQVGMHQDGVFDMIAARREGGTGHKKILKILRYDLRMSSAVIRSDVTDRVFRFVVECDPDWGGEHEHAAH